jgi:sugar/nucleoside kinase (ribokinase family)
MPPSKSGIALIGSCIVDELIPVIEPGQLSYTDASRFVSEEELKGETISYSTGGMALNVGIDLARIAGGYPLCIIGKVGNDHRAELIRKQMQDHGISSESLVVDPDNATSSTQVLHIRMPNGAIERIFRHTMGAMGSFDWRDLDIPTLSKFKIVMMGYGLLLPQFDLSDDHFGTIMGKCLSQIRETGTWTALDFISPTSENLWKFLRYRETIKHVDICCINEDQACALTEASTPDQACLALVEKFGARIAVVHCGAKGPNYAFSKDTGLMVQPNFQVKESEYKGNVGAGDAFSAGFLHGLHQNWPIHDCLRLATAAAAISLGHVSATGAMRSETEILAYSKNQPVID